MAFFDWRYFITACPGQSSRRKAAAADYSQRRGCPTRWFGGEEIAALAIVVSGVALQFQNALIGSQGNGLFSIPLLRDREQPSPRALLWYRRPNDHQVPRRVRLLRLRLKRPKRKISEAGSDRRCGCVRTQRLARSPLHLAYVVVRQL